MLFNRKALLSFYDAPSSWPKQTSGRGSHVSAITGLIGEDIVLGLLTHYLSGDGRSADVLSYKCKGSGLKGKRLDAWITCGDTIYQVEVKNWSAHSIGGYDLPLTASADELAAFAKRRWQKFFKENGLAKGIEKVMITMEPPPQYRGQRRGRILGFWSYIVNSEGSPLSTHSVNNDELLVFSASAYLRSLTTEHIEIDVPRVDARLRLLKSLVVQPSENTFFGAAA